MDAPNALPAGRPKPDFSGAWKLNREKSVFQGMDPPSSTTFEIDHREPVFGLSRTHVYGGQPDTWGVTLTTDGKEVLTHKDATEIRIRLCWEDDALVGDMTLHAGGEPASNVVRYSLADQGDTLVAHELFRSSQHNHDATWVFDKAR
jgi:hypothetical protein